MLHAKAKRGGRPRAGRNGEPRAIGEYLVVDPRVCHGKLTFRGTRVPVETILACLAEGRSRAYLRKSWPEVAPEAVEEAVRLATALLVEHHRTRNA